MRLVEKIPSGIEGNKLRFHPRLGRAAALLSRRIIAHSASALETSSATRHRKSPNSVEQTKNQVADCPKKNCFAGPCRRMSGLRKASKACARIPWSPLAYVVSEIRNPTHRRSPRNRRHCIFQRPETHLSPARIHELWSGCTYTFGVYAECVIGSTGE